MTKGRYDALKALLPPVDSPYSVDNLNAAETAALDEALGDGFGARGVSRPLPLPATIKSGLIEYSYFQSGFEEWPQFLLPAIDATFWSTHRYLVPFNFDVERLLLYFNNQWNRFSTHVASEKTKYAALDEIDPVDVASNRLFEKPWYELHARFLCNCHESLKNEAKTSASTKATFCISKVAGQLGRLVEQYYWKLRFEKAAVTGIGQRKAASRGGEEKARRKKPQHQAWKREAEILRRRHPEWSERAVAEMIRKILDIRQTAKHIQRCISKPKS